MLSRIREYLSGRLKQQSNPRGQAEDGSESSDYEDPLKQALEAIRQEDEVDPFYHEFVEYQFQIIELLEDDNYYWERIRSDLEVPNPSELTSRELFDDTVHFSDNLRRAFERDYHRYARAHQISKEFLSEHRGTNALSDRPIDLFEDQVKLFDLYQQWAMIETWKSSVSHSGIKLLGVFPDDEMGNKALHLESKKLVSDVLLTSSALIETAGETMIAVHREDSPSDQRLYNIIEVLFEDNHISEDEKNRMHTIRKQRNQVAHNIADRTELAWFDDFEPLVTNIFDAMDAIEYPLAEKVEQEVSPEYGDRLRVGQSHSEMRKDIDWESIANNLT